MRLKELRKSQKMTQIEISEKLNIPLMTYNNYENEKSQPNIEMLIKMANFHNVTLDHLVGRDFMDELGYLNKNEKELILMFRQMNQDNQLMFFAEAKGILLAQN